jgi:hypothetical protein
MQVRDEKFRQHLQNILLQAPGHKSRSLLQQILIRHVPRPDIANEVAHPQVMLVFREGMLLNGTVVQMLPQQMVELAWFLHIAIP